MYATPPAPAAEEEAPRSRRGSPGRFSSEAQTTSAKIASSSPNVEEVERGDGDHQESHRPRLLLLQLDREQLQARAHGAQPRRGEALHVADDARSLRGSRRGSLAA